MDGAGGLSPDRSPLHSRQPGPPPPRPPADGALWGEGPPRGGGLQDAWMSHSQAERWLLWIGLWLAALWRAGSGSPCEARAPGGSSALSDQQCPTGLGREPCAVGKRCMDILRPGALTACVTLLKSLSLSGPWCPVHKRGLCVPAATLLKV